jgi:hypothetical protein
MLLRLTRQGVAGPGGVGIPTLYARAVDQSLNLDRPIGRSVLLDIRFHLLIQ